MANIVKYFIKNGDKVFSPEQAMRDGGWGENILDLRGVWVVDRSDPNRRVQIEKIAYDRFFNMYFVHYVNGGWQCLDHAINQFEVKK